MIKCDTCRHECVCMYNESMHKFVKDIAAVDDRFPMQFSTVCNCSYYSPCAAKSDGIPTPRTLNCLKGENK